MTVKFLDPTGKELTAGQALDVWLEYREEYKSPVGDIHLFADAMFGYGAEMKALKRAGIEIKFGEES